MRSQKGVGQVGVGAAAELGARQLQGNVVNDRKEVKPMRTKYWIALAVLTVLLTATLAGDSWAQSTGRGCLVGSGDYDIWTVRVTSGYTYTIWMRADYSWVDFDLYVYDPYWNLVCSSTGSGPSEACSFFAWYSTYYAKVVSASGSSCYTIGIY